MVIELLQIVMEKTSFLTQIFDSQYYFQDFKMTSIDPHPAKPVLDSWPSETAWNKKLVS